MNANLYIGEDFWKTVKFDRVGDILEMAWYPRLKPILRENEGTSINDLVVKKFIFIVRKMNDDGSADYILEDIV